MGPSRQCQVCNKAQSKYKCPSCLIPYCSLPCFKSHKETPCAKPESTKEKSETPCVKPESTKENSVTPCVKPESTKEKSAKVDRPSAIREWPKLGPADNAVTTSVKPESSNNAVIPSVKPEISEGRASSNPGFQVESKLEVNDPSEVLQMMQMQAIASSNEIREALKDEHLQKLISDIDSSPDALNELDKAMGVDVFRIFSDKILSAINPDMDSRDLDRGNTSQSLK